MDINVLTNQANQMVDSAQHFLAAISAEQTLALLGIATVLAAVLYRVRLARLRERQVLCEMKSTIENLGRKVNYQAEELERCGRQLKAMQNYLSLLENRQKQLSDSRFGRKYRLEEAINFAGNGVQGEDIVKRAGITGGEARLISALYGKNVA